MLIKNESHYKGVNTTCSRYGCAPNSKLLNAKIVKFKASTIKGDFRSPLPYHVSSIVCSGFYDRVFKNYYYDGQGKMVKYDDTITGNTLMGYSPDSLYVHRVYPAISGNLYAENAYSVPLPMQSKMDNALLTKLANQDAGVGNFLAELPETVAGLTSAATLLVQTLIAIKSGKFNKAARGLGLKRSKKWLTKNEEYAVRKSALGSLPEKTRRKLKYEAAADRYLENQFAIQPLIADVDDFMRIMVGADLPVFRFGVDTSASENINNSQEALAFGQYALVDVHADYTIRAAAKAYVRVVDAERIAQKALGLHSTIASFYQVVPFSFLLDYVVNVGEFLELATATDGLQFINGYYSVKVSGSITEEKYLAKPSTNPDYGLVKDTQLRTHTFSGYRRIQLTNFPIPHLRLKFEDWNKTKTLNCIALAIALKS